MMDLLKNYDLAQACCKRKLERDEQKRRQSEAKKIINVRGIDYVRADLVPDTYRDLRVKS